MNDPETIALRTTVIGGQRCADDFTVIWRKLPVGRIMRARGLRPNVPQWRWTCNIYGKPGGGSGSSVDLDDCTIRAGLTEADIAKAQAMRRG
jgi:hypothetical protein